MSKTGIFTDDNLSTPEISPFGIVLLQALDKINSLASHPIIAAVICGHSHNDIITRSNTGIPCISTTCDAAYTSASDYDKTLPNRVKGTTTEQAFDVFHINTLNRIIYVTRIGAGGNREFDY